MEPSFNIISIDKEVKFKKRDLEALMDSPSRYLNCKYCYLNCKYYRVTFLPSVQYCISIYPNGNHPFYRGNAWIFLNVLADITNSVDLDVDIEYFIESANFSTTLNKKYKMSRGYGSFVCKTSELFDPTNNFFTDNEMIIKIKGIFKIYLPPRILYPISALWKIEEADLIPLKSSTTKRWLQSYTFNISSDSDVKYTLLIYPNGKKDEQSGKVQLYFQLVGLKSKIEAHINFSIDTALFSYQFSHVYEKDEGYGPSCVCSTDDLFDLEKRWIVNGKMTVTVSGTLMIEKEAEPTNLVLEKGIVQKGYHRGKNFAFIIGEKTVRVHKHVLKAASPVFEAMFDSKMKEAIEKKMIIVDFEYEIVHAAMKLLYSAAIPTTFSFEQMLQLLQFADKYDIGLIKDHVQAYLTEKLSPTNVCALIKFTSSTVDAPKLHFASVEYLVKRLEEKKAVNDLDSLEKDFILQILMRVTAQSL